MVLQLVSFKLAFFVAFFVGLMATGVPFRRAADRRRLAGDPDWYRDPVATVSAMTQRERRQLYYALAGGIIGAIGFFAINP
jgi:hypothetical protein